MKRLSDEEIRQALRNEQERTHNMECMPYPNHWGISLLEAQLSADQKAHQEIIKGLFERLELIPEIKPDYNSLTQFEPYRVLTRSTLEALKQEYLKE